MYKIPQLLRAPDKQSEEFLKISQNIQKSLFKPQIQEHNQPEFIVDKSLDEDDFQDLIPAKQMPLEIPQAKQYQARNYLEEFFDQRGIIERQFERKKKMLNAMKYEIPKIDKEIDQILGEFHGYNEDIYECEYKMNQIVEEAEQMSLKEKLDKLEGELDLAMKMEVKQEFMLESRDVDPNEKLELMYQDNQNVIEEYDILKEELLHEIEMKKLDAHEKVMLEQYDRRFENDNKLQQQIQEKIKSLKNDNIKLQLQDKLIKVHQNVEKRTQLLKRNMNKKETKKKDEDKKPQLNRNMYKNQIGFGKEKVVVKPL